MRTFNLDEAAAFLKISPDTMQLLARSGSVPGAKIGKCWIFFDEALESYLRNEVTAQTVERRRRQGLTVDDSALTSPTVPTAFARSMRRRPMEPPPLTPPTENSPPKRGRPARKPPPLPR